MVAQRPREKGKSIDIDYVPHIGGNADIVEEVYGSKIGQRFAYPESIWFSCYQNG